MVGERGRATGEAKGAGCGALLTAFGAPGVIVSLIAAGRLVLCYDARILAEYDDVLRRPVFAFEEENIAFSWRRLRRKANWWRRCRCPLAFATRTTSLALKWLRRRASSSWSLAISATFRRAVGIALVSCRPASSSIGSMVYGSRSFGASWHRDTRSPMTIDNAIRGSLFALDFLNEPESIGELPEWNDLDAATMDEVKSHLRDIFDAFPRDTEPKEAQNRGRPDLEDAQLPGLDGAPAPASAFPIVKRQETAAYGCYRSRDLCLAWTNALAAGRTDANVEG